MSLLPEPLQTLERLGHAVFTRGDYNLNIVCVRNDLAPEPNAFDDVITITYRVQNKWHSIWYPATTDPGRYWLLHPMRLEGTAILVPGQYRGSHQIGLHKGKPGLVQVGELEIYRDNDRDEYLDPVGDTRRGYYGINVHRAGTNSTQVDKWSAGCMVFKSSYHCDELMTLCEQSSELYGDRFTVTLIKASDLKKQ
jgi:hypothetical protein